MILNIDKNILDSFNSNDIYIFFYNSWCEWTKINILEDFNIDWLEYIEYEWKNIYYDKKDETNLDWWKILLKLESKEWHKNNDKYLFISQKIKSRCSCSTSFSFESKLIDSSKLKKLKKIFKQK